MFAIYGFWREIKLRMWEDPEILFWVYTVTIQNEKKIENGTMNYILIIYTVIKINKLQIQMRKMNMKVLKLIVITRM